MKKVFFYCLLGVASLFVFVNSVSAHCEIPCGIYDDQMRIIMRKN